MLTDYATATDNEDTESTIQAPKSDEKNNGTLEVTKEYINSKVMPLTDLRN